MSPRIVRDYQQELVETILDLSRQQNWYSSAINLGGGGGEDGGSGVPIGDFVGQLIQSKVAFDTTEASSPDIPASGSSLVTNLNRIRNTLDNKSDDIVVLSEFDIVGSGIRYIDFVGAPVTVDLVSGYTNRVVVSISGTGGMTLGGSGLVNVTENDTLARYLWDKIANGNRIYRTLVNPGGVEKIQFNFIDYSLGLEDLNDTAIIPGAMPTGTLLVYDEPSMYWIAMTAEDAGIGGGTGGTGGVLGGVTVVFEDLTSQIPGVGNFYTVDVQPIYSGSAQVFLNGLHQAPSYYTETSSGVLISETLTGTDEIFIEYLSSGISFIGLKVWDDTVPAASGIETLNFIGAGNVDVAVTSVGNRANITLSGSAGGGGGSHALGSATHTDVTITSVDDDDILAYDSGGDWINQTAAEAGLATAGHTHSDVVDVSADDTTAGYLEDKIVPGNNIAVTVLNEAGNEDLEIAATGLSISGHVHSEYAPSGHGHADTDTKQVLVSSNDTTQGYLEDKIVAGTNVTVTTLNEGANETVEITSTASGGGGGSAIEVRDEGVPLTSGVTLLDFVGGGVTTTAIGDVVTVTIPSGLGGGGGAGDFLDVVSIRRTSSQSIDNTTWTSVEFQAEEQDDWDGWDIGSDTDITLDETGVYQVEGQTWWATDADGVRYIRIIRNGTEAEELLEVSMPSHPTTELRQQIVGLIRATAGDTIQMQVYHNGGGSLNLQGGSVDAEATRLFVIKLKSGGGGSAINVDDEGINIASGITNLNFVGGGVTATASGTSVTVTVPSGGGGGGDVIFPAINVYDNSSATYTRDDSVWEQMGVASGIITPTVANAPLLTQATFHVEPYSTDWEHYHFRFVLDGSTYSDSFTRYYDASRPHDQYGKLWSIQYVYSGAITAGDHTVQLEWSNASDLNMRSDWRNLSAISLGAAGGGGGGGDTDTKQVLVSSNDTTEGYLEDKIVAGTNVTVTTLNEGANETVEITSTASGGGASVVVKDEGNLLTSSVTSLDFVGTGVNATNIDDDVTVTITLSGAAGDNKVTIFTVEGEVPVASGTLRMYNKWGRSINITNVFTAVSTVPSGSALIVDVNKGGTSIFTNQSKRPLIVSGAYTDTSDTPDIQTWESDSYLTMDVDQIGSTVAGSDLVVHVIGE